MAVDLSRHPCFNDAVRHRFARVHLPVAARCNIQCNFCNRKYDCMNESRPGVTSGVLSPHQAVSYLAKVLRRQPNTTVVGIAGPGDPFANVDQTLQTLQLVRDRWPEMLLCVASNGLGVLEHVDELARLDVSHVTITCNAVDPAIGEKVYSWVRFGKKIYRGRAAAELLWARQQAAIAALKAAGITVKINCILIPGVNDGHVETVAATMARMGADIFNCLGLYPVEDTPFADLASPGDDQLKALRARCQQHLPQMHHCTRCRADAAGLLGADDQEAYRMLQQTQAGPLMPGQDRPYVAVATQEGAMVNRHLGEADELHVFAPGEDGRFALLETRATPMPGGGDARWHKLAESLPDCRAVLCSGVGNRPNDVLRGCGLKVIVMEGLIDEALNAIAAGIEIRSPIRTVCGAKCNGDGNGCG